ncbi:hypothetical protein AGMMS49965_17500 [Bacteroidia bacterium]|nr:hypothetical protein AGMMS49965_17500 [Bacteroidia bacterium]
MLGVAEASAPLDFNHGNKYAYPVVTSNQIDLEETYVDLLNRQDDGNFQFVYDKTKNGNLSLRIHHTGAAKAFLNGSLVYSAEKRDYRHIDLSKNRNLAINGSNTLTVEGQLGKHGVALFALKEQVADDILFTPGQPNILRGPNGFEWWLIYMANKNAEPRGQYINRVHFFGKKLVVDGITGKNTPGEHPAPSKPTWQYLSDNNQQQPKINQPIPSTPATNYYFETGIKSAATNASNDGIIAWKADDDNWLKILIDATNKQWSYIVSQKGTQETFSFPLSADFKANVFHTVSLFKNHTDFTVRIDDLPAPAKPVIETTFAGKGLPGICSGNANATFDGITYTIGWDEYDEHIKGWQPSKDLPGLQLKGDLLDNYELSVQTNADAKKGIAAVYPVYINPDNYLKATFDFTEEQFSISGKTKGKEMPAQKISLAHLQKHYANSTFSDFAERHFIFDAPTTLDAILFKKEVPENFHIHYVKNGHWQELSSIKHAEWEHPGFRRIEFAPIETTELIFVPKTTENLSSLQEIRINERFKQNYNLRVVKNQKDVRIFVDGKQVCELPNKLGNSQVGLFSEQGKAIFSAITLFRIE